MRILIADDEPLARDRLRRLLAALPDCELCGEAATGREALQRAEATRPDLVLLDIRMPDMDGLEAARALAASRCPPAVVFTTAYDEHALAAFDACAADFLVKPIRRERLAAALDKARRLTRLQARAMGAAPAGGRSHLLVRSRQGSELVPIATVRYFRADHKYVVARTAEREWLIEDSLKSLERELGDRLLRVHRNALVQRAYLRGIERDAGGRVWVRVADCEERLEVSRRHLPALKRWLAQAAAP